MRERALYAFLDYLRREMAIDATILDPNEHGELRRRVEQSLKEPWAFDKDDRSRSDSGAARPRPRASHATCGT